MRTVTPRVSLLFIKLFCVPACPTLKFHRLLFAPPQCFKIHKQGTFCQRVSLSLFVPVWTCRLCTWQKKVSPKMQGWLVFVIALPWSCKRHRGAQEACLCRTSKWCWDKSDDTESLVSVNLAPTWMRTRWRVLKGINLDFNPWQLLCDAFGRPPRFCCYWHPGASPWMRDWHTGPLWRVQCVNSGRKTNLRPH